MRRHVRAQFAMLQLQVDEARKADDIEDMSEWLRDAETTISRIQGTKLSDFNE
jgi:hypothetical protein